MVEKIKGNTTKARNRARAAWAVLSAYVTMALCQAYAYASGIQIETGYTINESIGNTDPAGLIIGLAFWMARLTGIGMLIWGIYGYVTARKDGEAESMNGALGKLISGLVLICMPSVLQGLGILG